MATLKEAALAYAIEKHWPVFPVKADKTPFTPHGVMDATTDPKQIEAWWEKWPRANIGLDVGGAGMMVLDLDPGHSMEELEKNVGKIPDTSLIAHTPRGGKHLFFTIGKDEKVAASASKLAQHVDVRSFNSYVLLAPSRTSDGGYQWASEGVPAHRSDEMVRLSNAAKDKSADHDNWLIKPDLEENVTAATDWLKHDAKIAIDGQGGDLMAYKTAAHLKSFGISEEMAFDLMWEHWNPRCKPPWGTEQADHFEQKIRNGYAYNLSPPGNITDAYRVAKSAEAFEPVVTVLPTGQEWSAGRFRAVDRAGMQNIKDPKWLIQNFLPEDAYVLMWGAPGTFKTFIALDIALSIATGCAEERSCWEPPESVGRVLFAAGEGRASITNRVRGWENTHVNSLEAERFVLMDPVPLITEPLEPFIDAALAASPRGYKLAVIDTVGRSLQGTNENQQENASAFTHLVERLKHELGCTVLALHHTGHEGSHARGSSVFGADADTVLKLTRNNKDYIVDLGMEKQKDAPEWEKPKRVKLQEVRVTPEVKTLVVVQPDESDLYTAQKKNQELAAEKRLDLVEKIGLEILEGNKLKKYKNTRFGERIKEEDETNTIPIKGQQIGKADLVTLREDGTRRIARCWDGENECWRWQD